MQRGILNGKTTGRRGPGRPRLKWTTNIEEWTRMGYHLALQDDDAPGGMLPLNHCEWIKLDDDDQHSITVNDTIKVTIILTFNTFITVRTKRGYKISKFQQ